MNRWRKALVIVEALVVVWAFGGMLFVACRSTPVIGHWEARELAGCSLQIIEFESPEQTDEGELVIWLDTPIRAGLSAGAWDKLSLGEKLAQAGMVGVAIYPGHPDFKYAVRDALAGRWVTFRASSVRLVPPHPVGELDSLAGDYLRLHYYILYRSRRTDIW